MISIQNIIIILIQALPYLAKPSSLHNGNGDSSLDSLALHGLVVHGNHSNHKSEEKPHRQVNGKVYNDYSPVAPGTRVLSHNDT